MIKKFVVLIISLLLLVSCGDNEIDVETIELGNQIFLYGEAHANEKILAEELKIWGNYYSNHNMRHLFIEMPYYTGEYLNLWMKSESDEYLDLIYNHLEGTPSHNIVVKEFYMSIKENYPETIFHGTDVGHQYWSTGETYLQYLKENELEDTSQYILTVEAIKQGKYYYGNEDETYRENMMVENFIREFNKLDNENIMGIYGSAHTGLKDMNLDKTIASMANQLHTNYGDIVHSINLNKIMKKIR